MTNKNIFIYTFYRFKTLKNLKSIKHILKKICKSEDIFGTILISYEGINGTISGNKKELENFIKNLKNLIKIRKLSLKVSKNNFIPFNRFKIKIKKEIVTIGNNLVSPKKITGKYITPKNWDKIINDKNFLIIDTRNKYEIKIGSFKNAINPKTKSFREFPKFIKEIDISKDQEIAMFCTGGIRCEKASSYLLMNGYKNVYQLDGGILNYLQYKKDKKNTTWKGECFVFDNRVTVNEKLTKGKYVQCYGCRMPLDKKDLSSKHYIKGVKCPYCYKVKTNEQVNASKMRQSQIDDGKIIYNDLSKRQYKV
tara:strand:- start:317 stop:1243 length:927 start_codon:yes stop_codon:yes gene_type:complete